MTRLSPIVARAACAAALAAAVAACESNTEVLGRQSFGGLLSGAREKPNPTASTATGNALVILYSDQTMAYSVSWAGLTGAATGAHIHGPADSNTIAGVLIDFSAPPAGTTGQSILLTASGSASGNVPVSATSAITPTVNGDSLQKLLHAGLLYVNVHTVAHPNGEIRAQLRRQ